MVTSNPLSFNVYGPEKGKTNWDGIKAAVEAVCKVDTDNDKCKKKDFLQTNCLNGVPFLSFVEAALESGSGERDKDTKLKERVNKFEIHVKRDYQWTSGALWTLGKVSEKSNLIGEGAKSEKKLEEVPNTRVVEWPFNEHGASLLNK